MTIYIGADHRGFEMKNQLIEWLQTLGHDIVDCGNTIYDKDDDWNDYANMVSEKIMTDVDGIGILLCGSGVGVSMMANRHKGIRAALCFLPDQAEHARVNDHANIICLPSNYVNEESAKSIIDVFIKSQPSLEEKYLRRKMKLDSISLSFQRKLESI